MTAIPKSPLTVVHLLAPLLLFAASCGVPITECVEEDIAVTAGDTIPVEVRFPRHAVYEQFEGIEQDMVKAGLVNISHMDTTILVDLKYATHDNFLDSAVYGPLTEAYLRVEAAAKLSLAQDELTSRKPGFRLLVLDAARPVRVQRMMWDLVKDGPEKRYVANPETTGSLHNYGSAVDLTIVDSNNIVLDMGTPFDHFEKLAHPRHEAHFVATGDLSREQVANRKLLRDVMLSADFTGIATEWWHFNAFPLSHVETYFTMIP